MRAEDGDSGNVFFGHMNPSTVDQGATQNKGSRNSELSIPHAVREDPKSLFREIVDFTDEPEWFFRGRPNSLSFFGAEESPLLPVPEKGGESFL